MKLSFTTLGCPSWDLDTLCDRGSAFGYDGVDFRDWRTPKRSSRSSSHGSNRLSSEFST
jgi:hypothetical protein